MTQTSKQIYEQALRKKWVYKKHIHASINQIYEIRGRLNRKIKLWVGGGRQRTPALAQYRVGKRMVKRVTYGYRRRHINY
jgi:proteasome assembly chaperone (PAC2) family protein